MIDGEIEAHLMPEYGQRAGAGAVGLGDTVIAHAAHEVEVLLHGLNIVRFLPV